MQLMGKICWDQIQGASISERGHCVSLGDETEINLNLHKDM